jgi:hypothetical protein
MPNMSDIEDGFAYKRQRENARARGKKKRKTGGTHTIPPPPAKHILSSYTMGSPISKRAVCDYVGIQAREKVLHAEKVKSEHILGQRAQNLNRKYADWRSPAKIM